MGNQTRLSWFASTLHKLIAATVGRFGRGTKAQATLLYGGSSLICQCLRFVGIVISTRLIAADQFGLLATAVAMIGFSGLIKEIGQNSAYMSCRAEERGFTSFHFAWSFLFTRTVLLCFWYRKDLSFDQISPEVRRYYFRFARVLCRFNVGTQLARFGRRSMVLGNTTRHLATLCLEF
jgi:O-antigen/teichoic acid export membrane protein